MKSASTGRPVSRNKPTISPDDFRRRPRLRFFLRLVTGTLSTFVLATLTLFSLNAAMDHFHTNAQPAVQAETRQNALLPLTEKLAAVCWAGASTARMDSPARRCVELTAKIAQQLWGAPSSITHHVAARLNAVAARWLQATTSRLVPAWRGNSRHVFAG